MISISYYHTDEWIYERADNWEEACDSAFDILSMIESDEDGAVLFEVEDTSIFVEHSDGRFYYNGVSYDDLDSIADEVTMAISYAW